MAGTQDDDTVRFELDPSGDEQAPSSADTAEEPAVSGGPLGLGESPPPDAPSRHPRPKILSLLGEFFRMSRVTAILLTVFLLVGVLYLIVREDPVVGFGPAPVTTSGSTETSSATPTEATPTEATSAATPTEATSAEATPTGGASAPTASPQSQQSATGVPAPGGAGQQQAPQQQVPQQQQQQAPVAGGGSPEAE